MNTHTTQLDQRIENRISSLERSAGRWRLLAISATTLFVGVLIGGMGTTANQDDPIHPKMVVGAAGVGDRIFRVHHDGSMTAIRVISGERSAHGFFDWGDVKIDHDRINRTIPQP